MTQRVDLRKSELLGRLTRLVGERVERDKAAMAETLMREFYANVAPEDIVHRDPESLYGAAMALLSLARRRVREPSAAPLQPQSAGTWLAVRAYGRRDRQ